MPRLWLGSLISGVGFWLCSLRTLGTSWCGYDRPQRSFSRRVPRIERAIEGPETTDSARREGVNLRWSAQGVTLCSGAVRGGGTCRDIRFDAGVVVMGATDGRTSDAFAWPRITGLMTQFAVPREMLHRHLPVWAAQSVSPTRKLFIATKAAGPRGRRSPQRGRASLRRACGLSDRHHIRNGLQPSDRCTVLCHACDGSWSARSNQRDSFATNR